MTEHKLCEVKSCTKSWWWRFSAGSLPDTPEQRERLELTKCFEMRQVFFLLDLTHSVLALQRWAVFTAYKIQRLQMKDVTMWCHPLVSSYHCCCCQWMRIKTEKHGGDVQFSDCSSCAGSPGNQTGCSLARTPMADRARLDISLFLTLYDQVCGHISRWMQGHVHLFPQIK